ncbi:MAG: xanthine dehydrogenase family protein molybdopterin-binding subunit [Rhodospirillaceae bacterium]|nr:xanthine dehydrogenase family protein molybdopterin-binding subunit [Rhodospirillaceae bacterium]
MNNYSPKNAVIRTEDPRFLKGEGSYIDDINLPNQLYGHMLRSPHAHANIKSIDVSAAKAAPGVVDVFTGADYLAAGLGAMPHNTSALPTFDPETIYQAIHYPLAADRVRYVGDGVAFIVAETKAQAQDAGELVEFEYEILPAVVGPAQAISKDAPLLRDDCPNNIAYEFHQGNQEAVAEAMASAPHIVKREIRINRLTASPMETRGVVADYNPETKFTTVHLPTQGAFGARGLLANKLFNQAIENFRVVTPDVGGSFGMKGAMYSETPLAVWASQKHGRPVKWVSDRGEAFQSDCHARDKIVTAELALDEEYNFLALKVRAIANTGAYYSTMSTFPIVMSTSGLAGAYKTPAIHYYATAVFSNSNPMSPYRGSGRPDAGYIAERIIDIAARELGIDPAELRERNMITSDMMPFQPALGGPYDCGQFPENQKIALSKADYEGFEKRREEAKSRGKLLGIGVGNNVESATPPGQEWAKIKIDEGGNALLYAGSTDQGQGHATMYTQIICEKLGLSPDQVRVVEGDTETLDAGGGAGGSKVSGLGGSAVFVTSDMIIEKGKELAADHLEAAIADIEYSNQAFTVAGTDKTVSMAELAKSAPDDGLLVVGTHKTEAPTFPSGCHVCELEVDPDTGGVEFKRYIAVTDVGNAINPNQVDGQVQGGVVQALGQVLSENITYDAESGQLLSGSYMDYAMPKAKDVCPIETYANPSITERNPLGVKGAGEIGTGCAVATIVNALVDAMTPLGITHIDTPATAESIWQTVRAAK